MKRVICTGANGFIGTHTVKALLDKGYEVTALDLNIERLRELLGHHPRLNFFKANIVSDDLSNFIQEGDKVLHLAAVAHFITRKDALKAVQVNVGGTINVLEGCNKKAERIVYSSTGSVYASNVAVPIRENGELGPRPENYYGWSKLQAERWIQNYKKLTPHVILRYGYIYGILKSWGAIGDWMYNKIPKGEAPLIYGGQQTNDFTYVKDIVEANLLDLETPYINETINIGTGRAVNIRDACEACLSLSGSTLNAKIEPSRSFDYPIFLYDIAKARTLLRYSPKWTLREGISDMLKEMATQKEVVNAPKLLVH